MKQANNNEVDLLLRSFARRPDESPSQSAAASGDGSGTLSESDHLDADELNSYAEGVVPAPARARYMEHLADCGTCRRIVIGLTQASGAAARYEVPQQQGGSNFWQKLAALFSPAVLRFAVPALVLTIVIGIGLSVLRQRPQAEYLARNDARNSPPPSTQLKSDPALNPSTGATPSSLSSAIEPRKDGDSTSDKGNLQDERTRVAAAPITEEDSTPPKPAAPKDSAQPGEGGDLAATRPYALEPKAAAPPPPVTFGEAAKSAELAKERSLKREEQERRDTFRNQTDDEHGPMRSRNAQNNTTANTAAPATGRAGGLVNERGPSADKNKKAQEVETRVVSGRRFIREGNAWVDIDFEPPQATTRIARGSDQFRALVADEPGIRAIADQLNGVVIVVWKSRAYRIQ
jgi:hypothetical protein